MKVVVRRLSLRSLAKFGCVLGAAAAFLPSLLCGLLGLGAAELALRWLATWQETPITLLGQEVARLDFVQLLGLDRLLVQLQALTSVSGAVLLLAALVLTLVSGALLALAAALVGLAYNLLAAVSGGLVVEMAALDEQRRNRDETMVDALE